MIEKQLKKWFSSSLIGWHITKNQRTMPWKGIKDPYKIWLSEIILQQTRVEQGTAYYERFIASFPTIEELAAADETLIFKHWEGLGYYSRCRNLIKTAKYISYDLGGQFPQTKEGLLSLKGVGSYTAAAIGSFAFRLPLAVVDGNVMRVLSRLLGIDEPIDKLAVKKKFEQLATEMLGDNDPAIFNQAIMDLGATVCKPKKPLCAECPLQKNCVALKLGKQEHWPVKSQKIRQRHRYMYYLILQADNSLLIRQRKAKDIWQDLHEFVLLEKDEPVDEKELKELSNWDVKAAKQKLINISELHQHQLTHQKIHCRFIHIQIEKKIALKDYHWIEKNDLMNLAFPRLISRYLDLHFL